MNRSLDRRKIDSAILESTLVSLPKCICWLTENGKVIYINPFFLELLQYGEREAYDLDIFQMCPTLNRLVWSKHVRSAFTHQPTLLNLSFQSLDEVNHNCSVQLTKIIAERQVMISIVVLEVEDAIAHPLLGKLSKEAKIAAWRWKNNQQQLSVTSIFKDIVDINDFDNVLPLEKIQNLVKEQLDPEDRLTIIKNLHLLRTEYKTVEATVALQPANRRISIHAYPEVIHKKLIGIYGTVQLVKSQNDTSILKLPPSNILDYFPQILLVIESDGKIATANKAVESYTKYMAGELTKLNITQLLPDFKEVFSLENVQIGEKYSANLACYPKAFPPFMVHVQIRAFNYDEKRFYSLTLDQKTTSTASNDDTSIKLQAELKRLKNELARENTFLRSGLNAASQFEQIISQNAGYQNIMKQLKQVAQTDATVLILGETGTGKELLARAVHKESNRKEYPLVKINCAALPENLIESELFGHEKGAFTGAVAQKIGRFELADNGTIFLDEIGELPLELQPKLLRVLQEGEFERLGNSQTFKVNVRVIAATNRNLVQLIKAGKFREDLYYRLNVFPIENMPLRQRKDDVPLLAEHFVKKYRDKIGKPITGIQAKAMTKLMKYDFPGNIRELENIIERAIILTSGKKLSLDHWQPDFRRNINKNESLLSFEEMQKQHIIKALKKTKWRVSGEYGAAKLLQMNAKTLESKMRKYGLIRKEYFRK